MYCLKVVIARPDHKRPDAKVIVKHYGTRNEAEEGLKEIKQEYIGDFDDEDLTVEKLDEMMEKGELDDYVYVDCFMDIPAFEAEIFEVKPEGTVKKGDNKSERENQIESDNESESARWVVLEMYYKYQEYALRVLSGTKMRKYLLDELREYKFKMSHEDALDEMDLQDLIDLVVELGEDRVKNEQGWGVREINRVL